MATCSDDLLVNCSLFDSGCKRTLISWTVYCIEDERLSIQGLYDMLVDGCDEEIKQHVTDHTIEEAKVGPSTECEICGKVRLPAEEFAKLKSFPDPLLKDDGHYKSFDEVHGTDTCENDRPSLKNSGRKKSSMLFLASVQHATNTGMMLCCDECGM